MRTYAYLRASTQEQNAHRAREELQTFADQHSLTISAWFVEHESGATLQRPELFRLLEIAEPGDRVLVEQVDRISRLTTKDWQSLKTMIIDKGLRIVALDLPTSHQFTQSNRDNFTDRMIDALNGLMLDVLAAVARKDYEDRRKRQAQGIEKAQQQGKYRGRQQDNKLRAKIDRLLAAGNTYREIVDTLGCSKSTIASVSRARDNERLNQS